jgi:hypothetical protein
MARAYKNISPIIKQALDISDSRTLEEITFEDQQSF